MAPLLRWWWMIGIRRCRRKRFDESWKLSSAVGSPQLAVFNGQSAVLSCQLSGNSCQLPEYFTRTILSYQLSAISYQKKATSCQLPEYFTRTILSYQLSAIRKWSTVGALVRSKNIFTWLQKFQLPGDYQYFDAHSFSNAFSVWITDWHRLHWFHGFVYHMIITVGLEIRAIL